MTEREYKEMIEKVKLYKLTDRVDLANDIVAANEPLVSSIARKYFPTYFYSSAKEDIMEAGRIGLFMGIKKYNPEISKFSTFIPQYILGEIKRYISSEHSNMTSHFYNMTQKIQAARERLEERGIMNPTAQELQEESGVSAPTIIHAEMSKEFAEPLYIDKHNISMIEAKNPIESVEATVERKVTNEVLCEAISRLPVEHRLVILYAHGFYYNKEYTDTAISKILTNKGYKVNPAKIKKMRIEAINAIARDPKIIKTFSNEVCSRKGTNIDGGLFSLFSEDMYQHELKKLELLDSVGVDFDFSEEFVSSSSDDVYSDDDLEDIQTVLNG